MKNKRNKTFYGLILLGAVLTIPIAYIILNRLSGSSDILKAALITVIFVVLTAAILLIYRKIFEVPLEVLTQDKEMTELIKKKYWLLSYRKKEQFNGNYMRRLLTGINRIIEQIDTFYRRREVFLSLIRDAQAEQGGAITDMSDLVENAMDHNTDKIMDRIKIFDGRLQEFIVEQNLGYLEEYMKKNDMVLLEFEKLITEASSLGDSAKEVDISKLTDIVQALERLRGKEVSELEDLEKKYQ